MLSYVYIVPVSAQNNVCTPMGEQIQLSMFLSGFWVTVIFSSVTAFRKL